MNDKQKNIPINTRVEYWFKHHPFLGAPHELRTGTVIGYERNRHRILMDEGGVYATNELAVIK